MRDADHDDHHHVVEDPVDDPVLRAPGGPRTLPVLAQRLAHSVRIFEQRAAKELQCSRGHALG
jgi:hypothetical protein